MIAFAIVYNVWRFPCNVKKLNTLGGKPERFKEDMLLICEWFYDSVEELISHVVLVHFFGSEKVLIINDQ